MDGFSNKSNEVRAKCRARCRKKLAQHIEQQLGFRIDPLEVRLITSSDDPYTWSYMPEKAHLFQKHLSKHTMGACVELYDEVGKTFEAVRTAAAPHDIFDCQTEVDVSFTSTIKQLEQNYALLQQEHNRVVEACERWQAQATKNGQLRENMENELAAKKTDLESAYSVIRDLRRQLEKLQGQKASSVQQLDEISKMLNNIRSGLCTVAEPVTT
ncbi:hypothetical protein ACJQWK_04764 [Exserohilum turcicum]|uniref:Uncharacterized protein n=1 Tax=Exserohilum turcicum (strain 28A) TaxID=671987 RepID=R0K2Q2_EXST2|nr:uncharacterized protein SETTUDRAFT_22621 [Exserohilum turcica Et28A]EOA82642.1 hypothetical protein SETTUDRAFT_22621 [Exserohilum turcica Et28A]